MRRQGVQGVQDTCLSTPNPTKREETRNWVLSWTPCLPRASGAGTIDADDINAEKERMLYYKEKYLL